MKRIAMLFCSALILAGCNNAAKPTQQAHENSEYQEQLMREGWTYEELSDSELDEEYGVTVEPEEMAAAVTIEDLFNTVKAKIG